VKRRAAEHIASLLLRYYPPAFRREVGGEILQFVRTASASGARGVVWTVLRDALRSLPREWHAALVSGGRSSTLAPERRPGEPMRNLSRDFSLAGRLLARSPAFTIAAVVTLALGIGANTAMFTLADASLLRPIHVHEPERLVVWSWTSAYPDYQEYSKRTDLFEGVLAVAGTGRVNLVIDGTAELTPSTFVSGNAFDVLGVRAAHGRTLLPSDDVANGPLVAVLGYDYWRSRFGGNPAAIGRTVRVNGRAAVIVGVAEEGFRGTSVGSNPSIYLPTGVFNQVQTGFFSKVNALTTRGFVWLNVVARLRPDVPVSQAETAMTELYAQLHPRTDGKPRERLTLTPLPTRALGRNADEVRNFVVLLVGVVENTIVRELTEAPVPHVYLAFNQWLSGREGIATDPAHLFVRTRIDPAAAVPLVREQLRAVDPEVPMYDVVPFADRVATLVMPQRMGVALFTLFSALALTLATVGIYGVATYVASLRTREIGIRIALGATTRAVRRLVLVQGARPIVIAILAGLAMATYASRLAEAFLLNVSPLDPLTFATVPLTIGAIALVASYLPARRASRIEPVQALRDE